VKNSKVVFFGIEMLGEAITCPNRKIENKIYIKEILLEKL
jgi:hypothetical protein